MKEIPIVVQDESLVVPRPDVPLMRTAADLPLLAQRNDVLWFDEEKVYTWIDAAAIGEWEFALIFPINSLRPGAGPGSNPFDYGFFISRSEYMPNLEGALWNDWIRSQMFHLCNVELIGAPYVMRRRGDGGESGEFGWNDNVLSANALSVSQVFNMTSGKKMHQSIYGVARNDF